MPHRIMFSSLLLLTSLIIACSDRQTPTSSVLTTPKSEWPTLGWRTSSPAAQGIDPTGLARAVGRAGTLNLHSLLVIRNGFLVSENYYVGNNASSRHELYSVTKSFTATLVGIAVDKGFIKDINLPVLSFFPELEIGNIDANKNRMTLKHLLTMSSGLDWKENDPVYRAMYMSPNWVKYVLDTPMRSQPGSEFNYCSGCSHVLSAAVQQAAGTNAGNFAAPYLFAPLGIIDFTWDKDALGVPIGGWGLQLTPRDMAKLGYLYLHRGNWDGQQIVSEAWIEASTHKQVDSQGEWGYGYQWWIDDKHKAYAARGRYGQLIYVVPELNLIVVSTAAAESDEPVLALIEEEIIPAITPN